jgi:hypothetical protein
MRKTILRSVCFILFSHSVCADSTVAFDEEIKSPDSRVTVKLLQEESGCGISFSLNGKYVGNMKIAPFFSRKKVDICKARRRTVTSSWKPVWGFKAEYPDNYEEIAIDFSEPGKNTKYYSWDNLHNEIEVFDRFGKHLGVMDPTTGKMIKGAVKGRFIKL